MKMKLKIRKIQVIICKKKQRKEYILWGADKYDLSVDFDYHDWSGNEAIFDHFI